MTASEPAGHVPLEALLEHRAWVRALARSLVADPHRADDVEQETWRMALERPPRHGGALRAWFRTVVQNAARKSGRGEAVRARIEASARPRSDAASPADVIAEAEVHAEVVRAVLALDEPYCSTVLFRYFHGLEATEIAERTGVPVETVRTRTKRALEMLRGRLDREHGGDGRAWALALAPLVTGKKAMAAASAAGGAVMAATTKTILAAAAAGALLGALLTASVMKPGETSSSVVAPAESRDASRSGTQSASRPAEDVASPAQPPAAARSALAAAFDEVEIVPPVFLSGRITGGVRTKDGAGVAGVKIRASVQPTEGGAGDPRGPAALTDGENAVRKAVAYAKWDAATTREAVTDARGAFELSRLAEGGYRVFATAAGYTFRPAPGSDTSNATPGSVLEFVATAVVDVPVRVLAADGSVPSQQVLVRWSLPRGGGGGSAWWKAASPTVGVEPGEWVMTAEVGKRARSKPVTVTAALGTACETVTLQLESVGGLQGTVRFDSPEHAWESGEVTAKPKGSDDRRAEKRQRVTPPSWTFTFDDLAAGEYELSAEGQNARSPAVVAAVQVGSDRVLQDLVVPRPSPAEWLAVYVTGPDGKPVDRGDVHFGLRETAPGMSGGYGASAVPLGDGGFLVPLRVRAGDKELDFNEPGHVGAEWSLEVESKSCGRRSVAFDRGKTARLDVRFAEVAEFRPTIVGAEGTPLEGRLQVLLAQPHHDYYDALNARLGRSVEPGRYVALLYLESGDRIHGRVLARVPVDLRSGENAVTLRVPEVSTLTVRFQGAAKGTEVRVEPARRPKVWPSSPSFATDEGGLFHSPDLVAGNYRVTATNRGEYQEMIVRVPATGEVTFAPTALAGLSVTVDDASGMLARAGFQSGDLIVAIDGVAIDSIIRLENVFFGARGHESADVEVRRGSRSATIRIEPAKFDIRADYGGSWDPVLR